MTHKLLLSNAGKETDDTADYRKKNRKRRRKKLLEDQAKNNNHSDLQFKDEKKESGTDLKRNSCGRHKELDN